MISTRGRLVKAERCESYHAIDLAWLRRRKMLQPGRSSSIQWSHCGRPAGSIGIVAKANCVHLVYRHRAWGDQWQEMREIVSFTETRTCFGGRRRWFECPGCGRACRVLFGGPFRCRRCHGLHYSSQYQSAGSRTIGRLQALRTRLGGSGEPPRAVPGKAQAHAGQDLREAQGTRSGVMEALQPGTGERS